MPFSRLVVWLRSQRRWKLLEDDVDELGDGKGVMRRLLREAAGRTCKVSKLT